jgi:hypothetical protein
VQGISHTWSPNAEYSGKIVLSDVYVLATDPILAHEKPSRETLFDVAARIGKSGARHLPDKSLMEMATAGFQLPTGLHYLHEIIRVDPPRGSRNLDDRLRQRLPHAIQNRAAYASFISHHADLDALVLFGLDGDRGEAFLHEPDAFDVLSRRLDDPPLA